MNKGKVPVVAPDKHCLDGVSYKVEAKQLRWLQRIWCPAPSLQQSSSLVVVVTRCLGELYRAHLCRHHGHSFPGQAGQACYIWIVTTECGVETGTRSCAPPALL